MLVRNLYNIDAKGLVNGALGYVTGVNITRIHVSVCELYNYINNIENHEYPHKIIRWMFDSTISTKM